MSERGCRIAQSGPPPPVYVNEPDFGIKTITVPSSACPNESFSACVSTTSSGTVTYDWQYSTDGGITYQDNVSSTDCASFMMPESNVFILRVTVLNSSGDSDTQQKFVYPNMDTEACDEKNVDRLIFDNNLPNYLRSGGLFPNPSKGPITLNLTSFSKNNVTLKINLFDREGRRLSELASNYKSGAGNIAFDFSDLPNGKYYIQMINSSTKKIDTYEFQIIH